MHVCYGRQGVQLTPEWASSLEEPDALKFIKFSSINSNKIFQYLKGIFAGSRSAFIWFITWPRHTYDDLLEKPASCAMHGIPTMLTGSFSVSLLFTDYYYLGLVLQPRPIRNVLA